MIVAIVAALIAAILLYVYVIKPHLSFSVSKTFPKQTQPSSEALIDEASTAPPPAQTLVSSEVLKQQKTKIEEPAQD